MGVMVNTNDIRAFPRELTFIRDYRQIARELNLPKQLVKFVLDHSKSDYSLRQDIRQTINSVQLIQVYAKLREYFNGFEAESVESIDRYNLVWGTAERKLPITLHETCFPGIWAVWVDTRPNMKLKRYRSTLVFVTVNKRLYSKQLIAGIVPTVDCIKGRGIDWV